MPTPPACRRPKKAHTATRIRRHSTQFSRTKTRSSSRRAFRCLAMRRAQAAAAAAAATARLWRQRGPPAARLHAAYVRRRLAFSSDRVAQRALATRLASCPFCRSARVRPPPTCRRCAHFARALSSRPTQIAASIRNASLADQDKAQGAIA